MSDHDWKVDGYADGDEVWTCSRCALSIEMDGSDDEVPPCPVVSGDTPKTGGEK